MKKVITVILTVAILFSLQVSAFATPPEENVTIDKNMFCNADVLAKREEPRRSSKCLGSLKRGYKVHVIEQVPGTNWALCTDRYTEEYYVSIKYLVDTIDEVDLKWNGPRLTRYLGTIQGPTGKETYYNLNMSGCISYMKQLGYNYEYWVRSDGCKMYGDYIMVAANLAYYPKGSIVRCSLGFGIVVDTGTFIYLPGGATQLDIAVTW